MKQKRRLRTAACVLLAGTVLAAFVALAADAGSQGDPLVTLSYLNDTFLGQILEDGGPEAGPAQPGDDGPVQP